MEHTFTKVPIKALSIKDVLSLINKPFIVYANQLTCEIPVIPSTCDRTIPCFSWELN